MAAAFIELTANALDHVTDRHFDQGWEFVRDRLGRERSQRLRPRFRSVYNTYPRHGDWYYPDSRPLVAGLTSRPKSGASAAATARGASAFAASLAPFNLASSSSAVGPGAKRRYKNQLPSPERERDLPSSSPPPDASFDGSRDSRRPSSLERQSQTSARVINAYENEPDDPSRRVESVLPDYSAPPRDRDMSYANGYGGEGGGGGGYAPSRPRSQPPRGRYYDDDEGSDYDEREGRRYRSGTGRGYDDDRDYDREVIETERYRGPARPYDPRRLDSNDGSYAAGAVAPYRRSHGDLTEGTRRSVSRSRRDRHDRDEDRSLSRSRSRSRGGFKEKVDDLFDKSGQGLGVGIAGAVVGGLVGRQLGKQKHKSRDIVLGALIGGLGANVAENKYREWREEKRDRLEVREDRYLDRPYDGRARSSVR